MAKKPGCALIPLEVIEGKIFVLRGPRVMLDRDLAELDGVETRALNQAVKRNRDRFPEDFMFRLTAEKAKAALCLRSQIVILNRGQHIKHLPYAPSSICGTCLPPMSSSPGRSKRWRKKSASTIPISRQFPLCYGRSWSHPAARRIRRRWQEMKLHIKP